jgi:hypothetical protein
MRKQLFFSVVLMASLTGFMHAQTLVGTTPTNKNVVLEEFTGIHCQYCPDGHARAQQIFNENPGRVVLVNLHQGSYATPSGSDPDYRTIYGDNLAAQTALTGYPTGTVNRHYFPDYADNGGTAMGRGYWALAAKDILMAPSPVNVGLSSTFDTITRLLTVTVETYYTATSPQATNYINVALLENGIIGPQQVLSTWNTSYTHNHMLREFLTGQWGDTLTATAAGAFTSRTYTYTVPVGFNVHNCDVAAYVAESHQEVYTGAQVPAMGGTTFITLNASNPVSPVEIGTPSNTTGFDMTIESTMPGSEDFAFTFTTDAPADWSADYTVDAAVFTADDTIALTGSTSANLSIHVTPGTTPFIATYTLIMQSVSQPMTPPIVRRVRVVSDITDLILDNDAPWGDGAGTYTAADFNDGYVKGLNKAGNVHFAATPVKTFMDVAAANKLTGIGHIYYNVGWAFPSFTNELVDILGNFMDNGGNLMVCGQDAGWDTWDLTNGGNGTVNTQAFYTNYLHTQWVADGSASNSIMTPWNPDLVFTDLDTSNLTNVYGGAYFYPDQIDTASGSLPVFYYNSSLTKMGGLRYTNGTYKVVYLGVGVEMISDTNVRKAMVQITHDWFHGIISGTDEFSQALNAMYMGQNYPNPADDYSVINVSGVPAGSTLSIYDMRGVLVQTMNVDNSLNTIRLNTSSWPAGAYTYRLMTSDGKALSKRIVVQH